MNHLVSRKLQCCSNDQASFRRLPLRYDSEFVRSLQGFASTHLHSEGTEFIDRKECLVLLQPRKCRSNSFYLFAISMIRAREGNSGFFPFVPSKLDYLADTALGSSCSIRSEDFRQIGQFPGSSIEAARTGWSVWSTENTASCNSLPGCK